MREDRSSQLKRALALRAQGQSISEIAETMGIQRSTAGELVRGVERGPRGGYLRECALPGCGDLFFTPTPQRRYCCREHTVEAAHAAARARGTR